VLALQGTVRKRRKHDEQQNFPRRHRSRSDEVRDLSEAQTPPFLIDESESSETLRLKYATSSCAVPRLQRQVVRHQVAQQVRAYLSDLGFPKSKLRFCTRAPRRRARLPSAFASEPSSFYALPQEPQLQTTFDDRRHRQYFQIAVVSAMRICAQIVSPSSARSISK